jgi:hypothetical protein
MIKIKKYPVHYMNSAFRGPHYLNANKQISEIESNRRNKFFFFFKNCWVAFEDGAGDISKVKQVAGLP